MQITKDPTLLSQLRDGDEKAFKVVYDRHYKKIYQFAHSFLKDKAQSEEILQETFLQFWVKRDKLDVEMPVEPLLFTICKRLVLDAFRKLLSSDKLKAGLLKVSVAEDNETEEKIIFSDLLQVAEKAIARLPKQQQTVFRMSKIEGLSYEEIGTKLNISKHTVKNHFVVASRTLRMQLHREGVLSH